MFAIFLGSGEEDTPLDFDCFTALYRPAPMLKILPYIKSEPALLPKILHQNINIYDIVFDYTSCISLLPCSSSSVHRVPTHSVWVCDSITLPNLKFSFLRGVALRQQLEDTKSNERQKGHESRIQDTSIPRKCNAETDSVGTKCAWMQDGS